MSGSEAGGSGDPFARKKQSTLVTAPGVAPWLVDEHSPDRGPDGAQPGDDSAAMEATA